MADALYGHSQLQKLARLVPFPGTARAQEDCPRVGGFVTKPDHPGPQFAASADPDQAGVV